jgi:hypothetical protein
MELPFILNAVDDGGPVTAEWYFKFFIEAFMHIVLSPYP